MLSRQPFAEFSFEDLLAACQRARYLTLCAKVALAPALLDGLKDLVATPAHPFVEIAVEEMEDTAYLRNLYSMGFSLYYSVGLPAQTLIFLDQDRAFLLEQPSNASSPRVKIIKNAGEVYSRLLWHRFGNAVLISGMVKEQHGDTGFYCLVGDGNRERWFKLKNPERTTPPKIGSRVELFAWERWGIQALEVLDFKELEPAGTGRA